MARTRNIKPGFYDNEELAECSHAARLLFPALWQLADRNGFLENRPRRIKRHAFGYEETRVEPLLKELEDRGFIQYVGDGAWICIPAFPDHQNPHQNESARYHAPDEHQSAPGSEYTVEGKRKKVEGEQKKEASDGLSQEGRALLDAYPEHRQSTPGETMRVIRSVIKPAGKTVAEAIERIELWKLCDQWDRGIVPRLGKFFSEGTWLADPPDLKRRIPTGPYRRIKFGEDGEPVMDEHGSVVYEVVDDSN